MLDYEDLGKLLDWDAVKKFKDHALNSEHPTIRSTLQNPDTFYLSGSTITLTSCAIAVMMLNGWSVSFTQMIPFIMMLGITMVAAPGVPGGAVMAALGILESMLGFNDNMLTLMIALYIAQDSFGTACNVTGDGAIAMLMNAINGKKKTA